MCVCVCVYLYQSCFWKKNTQRTKVEYLYEIIHIHVEWKMQSADFRPWYRWVAANLWWCGAAKLIQDHCIHLSAKIASVVIHFGPLFAFYLFNQSEKFVFKTKITHTNTMSGSFVCLFGFVCALKKICNSVSNRDIKLASTIVRVLNFGFCFGCPWLRYQNVCVC